MDKDHTARVMAACQLLKREGYEDIAALLARAELTERKATGRKGKRVVMIGRVKGNNGKFYIDPEMLARGEVVEEE